MTEQDFDYGNACKVEINDGSIKCIWYDECLTTEDLERKCKEITDEGFSIEMPGQNALIEFTNGKKMIVNHSEWCFLYFIDNSVTNI